MAGTHVAVHTERQVLSPAAFMDFRYEVNRLLRGGETTQALGFWGSVVEIRRAGTRAGKLRVDFRRYRFCAGPLHDGWNLEPPRRNSQARQEPLRGRHIAPAMWGCRRMRPRWSMWGAFWQGWACHNLPMSPGAMVRPSGPAMPSDLVDVGGSGCEPGVYPTPVSLVSGPHLLLVCKERFELWLKLLLLWLQGSIPAGMWPNPQGMGR